MLPCCISMEVKGGYRAPCQRGYQKLFLLRPLLPLEEAPGGHPAARVSGGAGLSPLYRHRAPRGVKHCTSLCARNLSPWKGSKHLARRWHHTALGWLRSCPEGRVGAGSMGQALWPRTEWQRVHFSSGRTRRLVGVKRGLFILQSLSAVRVPHPTGRMAFGGAAGTVQPGSRREQM